MKRHLLSAADLSRDDALLILDTAEELAAARRPGRSRSCPTLRGRTVVNLFFEDSTRTRISFEAAAKRLSADVINFAAKGSSVSKGESLKDTALTLQAMGADAVVDPAPRLRRAAPAGQRWIDGSVVNAGDGTHEHPTQALLDAFTMRRHLTRAGPRPGRPPGHHRRRRPAQPGRPLQRAAAAHPRRRGHAGRAADPAAGRRRALAVRGHLRPGRGSQDRRGDDAAGPARADERGVLPHRARVLPPLRPRRRPAWPTAARARHRDAPRPDEPRHGDRRRGRRLAALAPSSSRSPTASRSGWPSCTCCSAATSRAPRIEAPRTEAPETAA